MFNTVHLCYCCWFGQCGIDGGMGEMVGVCAVDVGRCVDDGGSEVFIAANDKYICTFSEVGDCSGLVRENVGYIGSTSFERAEDGTSEGG